MSKMHDQGKTKAQLVEEITELRQEVLRLKQAEETLAQERNLLGALIDNLPDHIYIKDAQSRFLLVNDPVRRHLGAATVEEVVGKTDFDFSPPELAAQYYADEQALLQSGQPLIGHEELIFDHETGTQKWMSTNKAIFWDSQGDVAGLVGLNRDITGRKQAEEALSKRANQLAALNEISAAILDQSDSHSVYKTITQTLVNYFDMSFARIWVLEETANELVLQVSAGEYTHTDGPHSRVSMDSDRKLAWIAKQRTPHISNDLLNDPRMDDKTWVRESNTTAFAGYPLLAGDDLLGVLGMFSHQSIPDDTLPLLQSLAVLVGTFVNTQRLFNRLQIRAQEMETVAQVSTATSTILDVDRLLQEVADLTKTRFGLYHAHIYRLDNAQDTLILAAGAGEVGRQMVAKGWSIPLGREKSLVARAARTRQGVIVNDVRQESEWLPNPLLPDTRSELAVPMIVGNRVLGVLDVQSSEMGHFSDEDIHIQTTLAAQVGVAVRNAELFQQTQQSGELLRKRVEELNAMTELGREIAESPPITELLEWVTGRIPLAMQYPEICKVAIKYKDKIYGNPEAIDLPVQIVHALRIGNEVVGRIYIAYTQKCDFLNEESALLGGTANRLSSYIESRNLFDQIQQALDQTEDQANRLALLNAMNQEMNLTTTEHEIFEIAARYTSSIIKADRSSIALLTPDGNNLEVLALKGEKGVIPTETLLPVKGTSIGTSILEKRIVSTTDTLASNWLDTRKLAEQGLRSTISAPLVIGEQAIGTLNVSSEQVHAYTTQDESLLFQAASMVASTLENQRLFEQTQQRAAELEESTNFLDSVIGTIPIGVFVKEVENLTFVEWNKSQETIVGLSKEEVLGKSDYDFFPKEEAEFFTNADRETLAGGKLVEIPEEQIHTAHKGLRILRTIKVPLFGADGKPRFLLGMTEDITEQKQSATERERLLGEVQRLAAIVENHPDLIGVGTMEGKALYVNPTGLRMMGLPPDYDVTQMDAGHFYPPADADRLFNEGLPIATKEGSWTTEANLLKTDGNTIPVEQTIGINYGADGKPYSFSITMRDITGRKQAEEALRENEVRLSEAADIAQLGYWELDFQTQMFTFSDHLYALLRTTAAQEGGYQMPAMRYAQKFVHPDEGQIVGAEIQKAIETTDPDYSAQIEHRIIRADGSEGFVLVRFRIVKDEQGRTVKSTGANQDITERKQAEAERERLLAEIQQSQELLRSVIDATPDWIFIKDQEHRYRLANRGYADALHMVPEDFIGKNDLELGFPEELVKGDPEKGIRGFWADDRLVMNSGQMQVYPDDPATIDGVVHTFHTIKAPLRDIDGMVWGVLAFARDITERKQAEQERERLLAEVQATYRQYVAREWQQFLTGQHQGNLHIEHGQDIEQQDGNGSNSQSQIETPIALRGQVIGSLSLQDIDPHRRWTDEEKALVETISEQLAQTVENLRLFEDTQQRATREQLTREITDKMRAAPDVETIIKTGLNELSRALGVSRTYVKLSPDLKQDK